jgi:hypothetical protein
MKATFTYTSTITTVELFQTAIIEPPVQKGDHGRSAGT